jgi:CDP-diacylglycerol--serine O-phosphatidyltransferase
MKKIDILPNLITTGNFLSGIISIVLSLQGNFTKAALWILIGMVFDFLDGQVARLSKSSTKFGEEYDSLCDLVTFGIAPMIMIYEISLSQMGRFGWIIAFVYSVSCALRLARYNAKLDGGKKSFFMGLPSPAAGGCLASSVLAANHVEWFGLVDVAPFMMLFLAFLMISNIKYPSFGSISIPFRQKGPFLYLVFSAVALGGFILLGEVCLIVAFMSYAFGGLVYDFIFKNRTTRDYEKNELKEFEK